jgi:tetratricopeptide (TPR) repeat protein
LVIRRELRHQVAFENFVESREFILNTSPCAFSAPRFPRQAIVLLPTGRLFLFMVAVCLWFATAEAQEFAGPVVARVEMKLTSGEDTVDVIEKGDLLTVTQERKDSYVIVTHSGQRGAVAKVNAVKLPESVGIYDDLIEKSPEEGRYYTLRASAHWALGQAEKAVADFDKAIELGYDEAHAYTSRGLFHAEAGNFEKAIADYTTALKKAPEDIAPLINRAAVHMSQGNHEKAIEDYTTALKAKPDNLTLLQQRGIAWKAAGKANEAIADFDAIVKKDEKNVAALMARGFLFYQLGKHADAVADFSRVIEINPEAAGALNNRGYNRFMIGEYKGALEDYDAAIKLVPTYGLAHQNRAWLLATVKDESLRNAEEAVKSGEAACKLSNYQVLGDLSAYAAALAAAGKFEEAIGWQEKAVELAPANLKEFSKKMLKRYQDKLPYASPEEINAQEASKKPSNEEPAEEAKKEAESKE